MSNKNNGKSQIESTFKTIIKSNRIINPKNFFFYNIYKLKSYLN